MANIWSFKKSQSGLMSGSGTTRTASYTATGVGNILVMMLCIQGSTTIGISSGTSSQSTLGSETGLIIPPGGNFTANQYILLFGVVNGTAAGTISIVFSSSPATQPILMIAEFAQTFNGGLYYEDQAGGVPFDTYNTGTGSTITLTKPAVQYPAAGELYVLWNHCSVQASTVSGTGYAQVHTTSTPFTSLVYNLDYGNSDPQPSQVLSSSGFIFGLGCVYKIVSNDVPQCIPQLGVI